MLPGTPPGTGRGIRAGMDGKEVPILGDRRLGEFDRHVGPVHNPREFIIMKEDVARVVVIMTERLGVGVGPFIESSQDRFHATGLIPHPFDFGLPPLPARGPDHLSILHSNSVDGGQSPGSAIDPPFDVRGMEVGAPGQGGHHDGRGPEPVAAAVEVDGCGRRDIGRCDDRQVVEFRGGNRPVVSEHLYDEGSFAESEGEGLTFQPTRQPPPIARWIPGSEEVGQPVPSALVKTRGARGIRENHLTGLYGQPDATRQLGFILQK
jgi:hypothetical protein